MKTAHYLIALSACVIVVGGTLGILYAGQAADTKPAEPASPAAPVSGAEKPPEDPNMGFKSFAERFSYAVGYGMVGKRMDDKTNVESFLKGVVDGRKGEDTSYAQGLMLGHNLHTDNVDFDMAIFAEGLNAARSKQAGRLTDSQIQQTMRDFGDEMDKKAQAKAKAEAEANKAAGATFMAGNGKKEGWTTTPSGLQYHIINPGVGAHPALTDTFTALYEGSLIDGTVFDSTAKHENKPLIAPLNRMIPAWQEALPLIGRGGKMEIVLPSGLGYGDEGSPPTIPPGATLKFTFELQDFKPTPPPAPRSGGGGGGEMSQEQIQEMLRQMQQQQGGK